MVERVARAICIAAGGDPDRVAFVGIPEYGPRNNFIYVPHDDSWQKPRPIWQFFTKEAIAAIEAMRAPTQKMIDAAAIENGKLIPYEVWEAMIDEALK